MSPCRAIAGLIVVVALPWHAVAFAQTEESEKGADNGDPGSLAAEARSPLPESQAIDEITVTAGPQGRTAAELEAERLRQMKEAIYEEMLLRQAEEEEVAWRQADPDLEKPESRIKWGYSAQAELRMRRENDFINDLPMDQTKPATIFRAEF